jgi:hypothetical protein
VWVVVFVGVGVELIRCYGRVESGIFVTETQVTNEEIFGLGETDVETLGFFVIATDGTGTIDGTLTMPTQQGWIGNVLDQPRIREFGTSLGWYGFVRYGTVRSNPKNPNGGQNKERQAIVSRTRLVEKETVPGRLQKSSLPNPEKS